MDEIVNAFVEQSDELRGLGNGLTEEEWAKPSRCDGWTLSDVVLHLAQTNDLAIASAEGTFLELVGAFAQATGVAPSSVDDAADLQVRAERGASGVEVFERWSTSADRLADALSSLDPHARVQWVAGELAARTLATTRLSETWIHTGDVAEGLGVDLPPTPRLRHIARLAWRTLPYAFGQAGDTMAGPVAFDLVGPDGARWAFGVDDSPITTVSGDAAELCLIAARRLDPADSSLSRVGPDAHRVLELVRTYA